jgi:sugar O-acyltransferase (sialic acid O-acetyltransferase NeuD family)
MQPDRELLIFGTGGLAKETAQLARRIDPLGRRWKTVSYVAQSIEAIGSTLPFGAVRWLDEQVLLRTEPCDVAIGVGSPGARSVLAEALQKNPNLDFPNLVHPTVELDPDFVRLGRGNLITKGVVMTCDIALGSFNVLGWNVTIGHDATVGSHNVFNPGSNISGNTSIGDACLFGTGCQVLERLRIVSGVTIGAGAVVTRSISDGGTYVGVPARRVK